MSRWIGVLVITGFLLLWLRQGVVGQTSYPAPTDPEGGGEAPKCCEQTSQCVCPTPCSGYCEYNCGSGEACSSCKSQNKGLCFFTNPTVIPTEYQCQGWGQWGPCLSGQDRCRGCASTGYTCRVRFCQNPPGSNQSQNHGCDSSRPNPTLLGSNPTDITTKPQSRTPRKQNKTTKVPPPQRVALMPHPTTRLTDQQTNRLTDQQTNRLTDQQTNRLTDQQTNRLTD